MTRFEVSLKISGKQTTIVNELLEQGFTTLWKVKTIDRYYKRKESVAVSLKEKCLRLRKVESLINNKISYYFEDYSLLSSLEEQKLDVFKVLNDDNFNNLKNVLREMDFQEFLSTSKIDCVLKKGNYIFQIQDIENFGLIVSYDNEDYSNFDYQEQRKILIADLEKFGFKIIDYEDFDKFKELVSAV